MDIATLKTTYFPGTADIRLPSEPAAASFNDSQITPLIDGVTFFSDLKATLATIGTGANAAANTGHFIYIAGWWIDLFSVSVRAAVPVAKLGPFFTKGTPFSLEAPGVPGPSLVDVLALKASRGVDVRILPFLNWALMDTPTISNNVPHIQKANVGSLVSAHELRLLPGLKQAVCLNVIGHTAGAAHTKMVVASNGTDIVGYTGGMDFVADRHSNVDHSVGAWHDIQAKVEGPAVKGLFETFRSMWDEIVLKRKSRKFKVSTFTVATFESGTSTVPPLTIAPAAKGKHHVLSVRTFPQFNYPFWFKNISGLANVPITFAPSGLFEVRTAWKKAIGSATTYVYVEDQAFWSVEVLSWIHDAVRANASLKVVLVTGAPDPNDPASTDTFRDKALFDGLVVGLSATPLTLSQKDQIRVFLRGSVVVHSKTTIVDDHWAIIGSANCMRRSLYTDIEHAVAFVDEGDTAIQDYRVNLWAGHFDLPPPGHAAITPIQSALHVWESAWGVGPGPTLPATFTVVALPTVAPVLSAAEQNDYDRFQDVDSRTPWDLG